MATQKRAENISFSYKSTQEFSSLFNCAWGSGFMLAFLKYSVKEKNRRAEHQKIGVFKEK